MTINWSGSDELDVQAKVWDSDAIHQFLSFGLVIVNFAFADVKMNDIRVKVKVIKIVYFIINISIEVEKRKFYSVVKIAKQEEKFFIWESWKDRKAKYLIRNLDLAAQNFNLTYF